MSPPTDSTRGLSLRARWMLALLFGSVLPLAVFALVTLSVQREGLALAEKNLEVAVIDRVEDVIARDVDYASESAHAVGSTLTEGAITDDLARLRVARESMARAAALLHVAVYTPEGRKVDTIVRRGEPREPAAPESIPPGLVQSPPDGGVWLRAEVTPAGIALRYVEPLRRDGELRGWIVATLEPRWLDAAVRDVSQRRFGRPDRVVVVDDALRSLAQGGGALGVSLVGRDIFRAHPITPAQARQRFEFTGEFTEGERMVGTFRTVPERAWVVAVRRPESEAYAALAVSRRALIVGLFACAVLAVALGAWLAERTTRPVDDLVRLTEAYGSREFATRSSVRTGDELETLGGAMERMADAIVASEIEIARRAKVESDLARFLPAEVARTVARGEASLSLGGARREVTVLFADVAAFTTFAEGAPPEKVVAFLNELFTVLTEVVFRHGGMVDKFIGDCVMAVFGADSEAEPATETARRALAAAEDMHRFVESSAPAWKETYGIDVRLGIGVDTGAGLVGNLGSESRMEYTVIGDVANVASRLEALARGGQTLATAAVVRAAGRGFSYNPLGEHPLRGKREPVEIFEVML